MSGETLITTPTCEAEEDCDRLAKARGMCHKHYLRWWKSTPPRERQSPIPPPRPTPEQRFWAKVDKHGPVPLACPDLGPCWMWTGSRRRSGHGQFAVRRGLTVPASEFSLQLVCGYFAPERLITCHRCDNPPCVNPSHLYYGTYQDNANDAWARGRMPVGSQRAAARMTEAQVVELRERYAAGADLRLLAAEYGVATSTAHLTVLGHKWKHVGGPITRRRIYSNRKKAA